jgi:vacuolar-type H+-ATPase subunit I/STV1
MSDESNVDGVNDGVAGGEAEKKSKEKNVVAFETYQKTLDEAKKAKNQLKEYQTKLSEFEERFRQIENEKLSTEGKKDEVLKRLEADLTKERDSRKKERAAYAWSVVSEKVKSKAIDSGLIKDNGAPDRFINLLDLSKIQFDDEATFKIRDE